VISSNDPQALLHWLRTHHYQIPAESVAEMQPYVAAHQQFLALRLHGSSGVQQMEPVKISYANSSSEISLPLRMATPMDKRPLSVLLWIFGSMRYQPQNYQSVSFSEQDFNMVADPSRIDEVYAHKVSEALRQVQGHAFITEYAQPSAVLLRDLAYHRAPFLQSLAQQKNHGFVTRLFTRMAPEQMDRDPIFVAHGTSAVDNLYSISNPASSVCRTIGVLVILMPVVTTVMVVFVRRRRRMSKG
jgi:hypothetical protein